MIYSFADYKFKPEDDLVEELLLKLDWDNNLANEIEQEATKLVKTVRGQKSQGGQLEKFLKEFSLNTEEGLAMMCLAEALLRIPDAYTTNLLIKDKVAAVNWLQNQGESKDWLTKAASFGLAITKKTLDSAFSKLGEPIIREAMAKAMQMMGKQFVMGANIQDAIAQAMPWSKNGHLLSYDMLGEGARDRDTAQIFLNTYSHAIDEIAKNNDGKGYDNAGISIKLSALHPRYTYTQAQTCLPEMIDSVINLCQKAAYYDMPLTIDAEEVDRLELSIQIFDAILEEESLKDWTGLGLALQSYQKRALPLIQYLCNKVRQEGRYIHIRLIKGAYWDTEIKRAQVQGLKDYPVFTRKSNTDLSYLVCAQEILKHSDIIYPMFATHNAHTIIAITKIAAGKLFEFQRLHGMGDNVYKALMQHDKSVKVRIYAPVGPHHDLLPYLVRRLLENGANSSFVNQLLDSTIEAQTIVKDPISIIRKHDTHQHPDISLPANIFGQNRLNSSGVDYTNALNKKEIEAYIEGYKFINASHSIINGQKETAIDETYLDSAISYANAGFHHWDKVDIEERAKIFERFAGLLEEKRNEFIAIMSHEAGKTILDSQDEIREAVDFARYYAQQARILYKKEGTKLTSYTGEDNILHMKGRGVFVCISPWNFPLAIFIGQISAALLAGNAVLAKPASQTPYVAMRACKLLFEAGLPVGALHLLLGDRTLGAEMVKHPSIAGIAFTGSTNTAKSIQKAVADNNPRIIPIIAETGGQNAMIVDSSALTEQIVDDVLISAFGSAGQRCSALRVLYLQEDIADRVITLLKGAMAELNVASPRNLSADIGYIIDDKSKNTLEAHLEYISKVGELVAIAPTKEDHRLLFAPRAYEISSIDLLKEEVFGPILHIIRYRAENLHQVIEQINATGYGLTCGIHSRINLQQEKIAQNIKAGNIYINRSMIGAIVGVQPFGGMGLSGTGPKAGGPHYLASFGVEKHVSTNTTASGGNAALISLSD